MFSGSLATAMRIVGSDFVTKSGFMFAGERLWNKVSGGGGGRSTESDLLGRFEKDIVYSVAGFCCPPSM